jgi:geranylgeranyl reductase family protein
MELYDVIVVGAGPAGATAARLISSEGLSVLVLEQAAFGRPKPCAGWVSPWVFDLSGVSPREYANGRTLVPFSTLVVWDGDDTPHPVSFARTVGYGIVRSEFDSFLASRTGGARIEYGTRVTTVDIDGRGVVINGAYRGRVVIGAGGHRCPVARQVGAIGKNERFVTAVVSETRVGREVLGGLSLFADCPQVVFNDDLSGYGWYFPKGEYLNVGVGAMSGDRLAPHRDALLGRLAAKGMLPDPGRHPLAPFVGHAYKLMRLTPRRLVFDRVLLVGDAAGVAYNVSGEGIGPAIFSGVAAAETIIGAKGDYGERALSRYVARLHDRLGRPYGRPSLSVAALVSERIARTFLGCVTKSALLRRELVARRWFFRD